MKIASQRLSVTLVGMGVTTRIVTHGGRIRQRLGRQLHRPESGIPLKAAVPFLPPDPVIIEAGASTGMDLPEMLRLWPKATIHAFEPEPQAFGQLAERAAVLPSVYAWNLALGTEDGEITMNVSHGPYLTTSSSLLEPGTIRQELPDVTFTHVEVRQQTLSSWAIENSINRVDLLALDMQGYEHAALSVGPEVLSSARVVITEAFLQSMYEGAATVDRMQALLADFRFVIMATNLYYGTTIEVMAVRRDVLEAALRDGLDTKRGFVA